MNSVPKLTYQKVYLIVTALVGVALTLFMVFGVRLRKYIQEKLPVNFSFLQESNPASDHPDFKLILNSRSYRISFVKVRIFFDPELVQLAKDIDTLNSPLSIISATPSSEANKTGSIEITLAQTPEAEPPQSEFEIADLLFDRTGSEPAELTLVDEDTQVIDINEQELPFTSDYALMDATMQTIN